MWRNRFGLIVLILVLLASCKSKETISTGAAVNISDARLRSQLKINELQFDKLYLKKVQFSYTDGDQNRSFKGSFVIQKDSQIIVSIFLVMGIELVRARLTPNDIIVLDKHNRVATITDYQYLNRKYGFDINYYSIQSILSNSLFVYPPLTDSYDEIKRYKNYVDSSHYVYKSIKENRLDRLIERGKSDFVVNEIYIYPDIFKIFRVFINDYIKKQSFNVLYSNFKNFDTILFPEQIDFTAIQGNTNFKVQLKINNLEINDGGSTYFKIPSTYKITNL